MRQRDKEKTAIAVAKLSSGGSQGSETKENKAKNGEVDNDNDQEMDNDVFEDQNGFSDLSDPEVEDEEKTEKIPKEKVVVEKQKSLEDAECKQDESDIPAEPHESKSPSTSSYETVGTEFVEFDNPMSPTSKTIIITDASVDIANLTMDEKESGSLTQSELPVVMEDVGHNNLDTLQDPKSTCASPASSNGGIYSVSLFCCSFVFNL